MATKRKKQNKKEVQRFERLAQYVALSLLLSVVLWLSGLQFYGWVTHPNTWPVKVVRIDGDLKYLQISELENAIATKVSGGFFKIDLQEIKQAAKQLPWVDAVSVKRLWPDTLVMMVTEKVALARWGKNQLITNKGVIFSPLTPLPKNLPYLEGPTNQSIKIVDTFVKEFKRFKQIGLNINFMTMSDRGAWVVGFENGMKVDFGHRDIVLRFNRLARYIREVSQIRGMPKTIDLRYQHGMAVSWGSTAEDKGAV